MATHRNSQRGAHFADSARGERGGRPDGRNQANARNRTPSTPPRRTTQNGQTSARLVNARQVTQAQARGGQDGPRRMGEARVQGGRGADRPRPTSRDARQGTQRGQRDGSGQRRQTSGQRRPQGRTNSGARTASERGREPAHNGSRGRSYQAAHSAKPKRRSRKKPVAITVFVLLLVLGGVLFLCRHFIAGLGLSLFPEGSTVAAGESVTITIPDGADGATIQQTLLDAGVISDAKAFQQAVQAQNADQKLKSGSYTFLTGSDPSDVVKQLVEGPNATQNILNLAEGLTVEKTAEAVEGSLGISKDDFVNQAKASNYASDYPFLESVGNDSLEGFLYATRYDFNGKEITADSVIRAMLDQYQANIDPVITDSAMTALQTRYPNLENWTKYDVLVLASIIEQEALTSDQRYQVASVFYNRMNTGMALQSDTTMAYVTGGQVTEEDNHADSPYNTYDNQGVPPTPICSPRLESVQAALNPAQTDYYYFWITQTESVFSQTYAEHQQAIANATNDSE